MGHDLDRTLLEINNAIVANLTRESLLHAIGEALQRVLQFDRVLITLYDPAKDVRRILAVEGRSRSAVSTIGAEFVREASHAWGAFDRGRPVVRPNLGERACSPMEERLFREGLRSLIAVPLLAHGRSIGTLSLCSETSDRYSEADGAFVQGVANQIALAVENMQAHEEIAALKARLEKENVYLRQEIQACHDFDEIVGRSPALRRVLERVDTVSRTDSTVLLIGETGTGKELFARAIHDRSRRKDRALIKVNCASLPTGLVESELFGHEKGAFTGAIARKIGRFELADGGTIFLDEVGDVPHEVQVKLLRVLQEREFERVGGTRTIPMDVRVIAASNRDLEASVAAGAFRADLYYRLNVFPVRLPALRERAEDIPLLVRYFAAKFAGRIGKRIERITDATFTRLAAYPWPGNVRELQNVIERAVILARDTTLDVQDDVFGPCVQDRPAPEMTLQSVERDYIVRILAATRGVIEGPRGAARRLGLHPNTLRSRLSKLGIERSPTSDREGHEMPWVAIVPPALPADRIPLNS